MSDFALLTIFRKKQITNHKSQIANIMDTELQLLVEKVKSYSWYPPEIRPLYGDSNDTLFFPAGPGMYSKEEGRLSEKAVMIIGDRYSPNLNVLKVHGVRQDHSRSTHAWNELLDLLIQAGIDPLDCFFTNYLLGIRSRIPNSASRIPHPISRMSLPSSYFRDHCRDIFRLTLELQRPRLILVLGLKAASFLSRLHPQILVWQNIKTYNNVDDEYSSIIRDVPLVSTQVTTLVLLLHPVRRKTHISSRKNGNSSGNSAETRLLRTVVASCKL